MTTTSTSATTAATVPRPRLPLWARCLLALLAFVAAGFALLPVQLIPGFGELMSRTDAVGITAYVGLCGLTLVSYLLLSWLLVRAVDRRPFRALGLRLDGRALVGLLIGMAISLVVVVGVDVLTGALGWSRTEGSTGGLGGASWATVIVFTLARAFVLQGIGEEALMRGYLLQTASAHPRWAVLLSATVFTIPHLLSSGGQQGALERVLYLAIAFGFGLAAAALSTAVGSAWAGIGIHGGFHVATAVAAVLGVDGTGPAVWLLDGALYALIALAVFAAIPRSRWRRVAEVGPYGR